MVTEVEYNGKKRKVLEEMDWAYNLNIEGQNVTALKKDCKILKTAPDSLYIKPDSRKGGRVGQKYGVDKGTYTVFKRDKKVFEGSVLNIALEFRLTVGTVKRIIKTGGKVNNISVV